MTRKINCCGMDARGIDAFLNDAEQTDKGTTRFPWPKGLKDEIKDAITGMQFMPAVKELVDRMVLAKAGPGLSARGPFNTDPRVR
jgi:hypothetical protein